MLAKLQGSGNDWVQAVRDKDLRKLHVLVNMWATLNCTPTEFVRADSLGKKTVTCSLKNFADDELLKKLEKVHNILIDSHACFELFALSG